MQVAKIIDMVPRPPGPPQDALIEGLHPDIAPLRMAVKDVRLEAALLAGAEAAAAREQAANQILQQGDEASSNESQTTGSTEA